MNEITEKDIINIEDMIYEINGLEVMLDSDLAKLYGVETKRINEAVKNNPKKFPERYLFRISEFEYLSLKSKISTSKGGSSFKDLGKKCFYIGLVNDKEYLNKMLNILK